MKFRIKESFFERSLSSLLSNLSSDFEGTELANLPEMRGRAKANRGTEM